MSAAPSLRVLSVNLCAISPGANLRCPVALMIAGALLALLLPAIAALTNTLPSGCSVCCTVPATYGVYGVMKAKGAWHVISGMVAALLAAAFWYYPVWPMTWVWWSCVVSGFVVLLATPLAQILNYILILVRPGLTDNFVGARLELFLEHLFASDYDLVCIQELTVTWGQDAYLRRLVKAAADKFPYSCGTSPWPLFPALTCGTGIVVLSKWPIESFMPFGFQRQAIFEFHIIARGGLLARLRHPSDPGVTVELCTVHTTSGLEVIASEVSTKQTTPSFANPLGLQQLLEALDRFEAFTGQSKGIDCQKPLRIFCGDFNLDALGGRMHEAALSCFGSRARERLDIHDAGPYSEDGAGPTYGCIDADGSPSEWLMTKKNDLGCQKRLDFIYANREGIPGTASVVTMRNNDPSSRHLFPEASDHRGVAITF